LICQNAICLKLQADPSCWQARTGHEVLYRAQKAEFIHHSRHAKNSNAMPYLVPETRPQKVNSTRYDMLFAIPCMPSCCINVKKDQYIYIYIFILQHTCRHCNLATRIMCSGMFVFLRVLTDMLTIISPCSNGDAQRIFTSSYIFLLTSRCACTFV